MLPKRRVIGWYRDDPSRLERSRAPAGGRERAFTALTNQTQVDTKDRHGGGLSIRRRRSVCVRFVSHAPFRREPEAIQGNLATTWGNYLGTGICHRSTRGRKSRSLDPCEHSPHQQQDSLETAAAGPASPPRRCRLAESHGRLPVALPARKYNPPAYPSYSLSLSAFSSGIIVYRSSRMYHVCIGIRMYLLLAISGTSISPWPLYNSHRAVEMIFLSDWWRIWETILQVHLSCWRWTWWDKWRGAQLLWRYARFSIKLLSRAHRPAVLGTRCKEVGQVREEPLRGETGSRFIHISRRGLERPRAKSALSLCAIPIHTVYIDDRRASL